MSASELYSVLQYDITRFDFPRLIATAMHVRDFTRLRDEPATPIRSRDEDQSTPWHESFYASFEIWRPAYIAFIERMIAPLMREPCFFQSIPNFRISTPGNRAVGEFHRDSDYNHPPGEVNFWLPLTVARDSAGIILCDKNGRSHNPDLVPGDILRFDATAILHGNVVNKTRRTRASFDFRLLPVRFFQSNPTRTSINTKKLFAPGDYYNEEPIQ